MTGNILGNRYELIEKIGDGGMSVVYKARCRLLNRYVAVKILKEEFVGDKDFVEKFKREAAAVASLSDSNIVNIYDVGSEGNIHYIVMEYVNGKNLKEIIQQRGKLAYRTAIHIAIQIAKALECAHKNNIIHRDVKPHNIMVTEDGIVKVGDFGIAKASNSITITNSNKVIGSAHYFSPEQAKGSYVDCRTDIYSLGIVLYEMVTGRVPYDADSPVSVALKHIQEVVVPPKQICPELPDNLNQLILKAIEKEPIKRYQNVKDMLFDLQKIERNAEYHIPSNNFESDHTRVMDAVVPEEEEEDEEDFEEPISGKKRKVLLFSVMAILAVAIGIIMGMLTLNKGGHNPVLPINTAKETVVPKLIGLSKEDAEKATQDVGLKLTVIGSENSDKPEGTILQCSPEEGTNVKANSEVRVIVSGGVKTLTAPNLKDIDINSAKDIIANMGLTLGNIDYTFSDTAPKDTVISQTPDVDSQIDKTTKINLVVSKGAEIRLSTVPNLIGTSLDEATALITSAKLKLGTKTIVETSDKSLDGKITSQSIEANTQVREGSTINISYNQYKEAQKVKVPQLTGITVLEAKALAAELGLKLATTGQDKDVIKTQEPVPDTLVDAGSTIVVTVETGSSGQQDQGGQNNGDGQQNTGTQTDGTNQNTGTTNGGQTQTKNP